MIKLDLIVLFLQLSINSFIPIKTIILPKNNIVHHAAGVKDFQKSLTIAKCFKNGTSPNKANPNAVSATDEIEQTKKKLTQSTRKEDGTATCLNKGCQKNFLVAENNPNACTYHSKEPVFHDTVKYWSCCPANVSYDFDAFLNIEENF